VQVQTSPAAVSEVSLKVTNNGDGVVLNGVFDWQVP
jgi:hypothetical protein